MQVYQRLQQSFPLSPIQPTNQAFLFFFFMQDYIMQPFPFSQARLVFLHSHGFCSSHQRSHRLVEARPASGAPQAVATATDSICSLLPSSPMNVQSSLQPRSLAHDRSFIQQASFMPSGQTAAQLTPLAYDSPRALYLRPM